MPGEPIDIPRELARSPVFRGLAAGTRADLAQRSAVERRRKGDVLVREGERAGPLHILLRGWVKVSIAREGGRETLLGFFGPPLMPGLVPRMANRPSVGAFVVMSDAVLLRVEAEDFERLLATRPDFAAALGRYVAVSMLDHTRFFHAVRTGRIEARLARLLLALAERYGTKEKAGLTVHLPATRQEIADAVDATVSEVIRRLRAWEREGVVETSRGRIALRRPEVLREAAGAFP